MMARRRRGKEHNSVHLVGRARNKEVDWKKLTKTQLEGVKQAIAIEWDKWVENSATKFLSDSSLKEIMAKNP